MGTEVKSHEDLRIWKGSVSLVIDIYKLTGEFPKHEIYGLVSQMRRAAISVPSNIAEGAARLSTKEFGRFLVIASGSLSELESQLILCADLGLLGKNEKGYKELTKKIHILRKQIYATLRSLRSRS